MKESAKTGDTKKERRKKESGPRFRLPYYSDTI
jgi:hypothetical protein